MRLIDADALAMHMADWQLSAISDQYNTIEEAIDAVTSAPTIDAVQVVRCKDCVSFRYSGMGGDNGITYCASMGIEMQPTDFCSYGERKDND